MVVIFLSFVAVIAVATSFQSSTVRRMGSRSHLGFEAIELCDSAVNEAAAQVMIEDVFPTAVFKNSMKDFCIDIGNDDRPKLDSNYPGFKVNYRPVRNRATQQQLPPPNDWIFISMNWPKEYKKTFRVPLTVASANAMPGIKSFVSAVTMWPLSWRRDFAGLTWQNWGVLRYDVSVTLDDGSRPITRTMFVDRMFTVPANYLDPTTGVPVQQQTTWLDLSFQKSTRNLKTVIKRG